MDGTGGGSRGFRLEHWELRAEKRKLRAEKRELRAEGWELLVTQIVLTEFTAADFRVRPVYDDAK